MQNEGPYKSSYGLDKLGITGARTVYWNLPPARLVETIFAAVGEWRGDAPPNDDMTAVAVRITT